MASLIINTGVPSHPQISIDEIDLQNGRLVFHWIGGPHSGACAEDFPISFEDHGALTINQVAAAIAAAMIAKLPVE